MNQRYLYILHQQYISFLPVQDKQIRLSTLSSLDPLHKIGCVRTWLRLQQRLWKGVYITSHCLFEHSHHYPRPTIGIHGGSVLQVMLIIKIKCRWCGVLAPSSESRRVNHLAIKRHTELSDQRCHKTNGKEATKKKKRKKHHKKMPKRMKLSSWQLINMNIYQYSKERSNFKV